MLSGTRYFLSKYLDSCTSIRQKLNPLFKILWKLKIGKKKCNFIQKGVLGCETAPPFFIQCSLKWHNTITLSQNHYNILKKYTNISTEMLQTYCLAFPVIFTQETLKNMDHKLNFCQNTVYLVEKFTQALNILHDRWSRWAWYFACLGLPCRVYTQ